MHVIVGLGNPGEVYANTFHNAGFLVLDLIATKLGAKFTTSSFHAMYALSYIEQTKVLLVKPTTYMNLSGKAVGLIVSFYKIDIKNLIVVRDDIDIELGRIRLKRNSSSGGHKGIQSIIDTLGSKAFVQVKIGVRNISLVNVFKGDVANYVLKKLSEDEKKNLSQSAEIACEACMKVVADGFEKAANLYNN
ncbi:peptidyl-tRNA hydrolase, PTH1 family [Desulfurella multipotens]|uniref:Peptidyl-tRNA hydrolase n=1 Tax=Desulfurella multipotens TaxID=79269 RepID=A0A1G6PIJ7_9BACT|nr:aminoacyl-tRNA hydrolase [Desulfurella multipotens]SDC79878.1 peptidyl-tRNA hydrolase, PTH1 family [Desulfurella multipotens]